jgi:hypothetical protein
MQAKSFPFTYEKELLTLIMLCMPTLPQPFVTLAAGHFQRIAPEDPHVHERFFGRRLHIEVLVMKHFPESLSAPG